MFAWLAKLDEELQTLFRSSYDKAQMLFLCYYKAVLKIFPEGCWWARKRS